MLIIEVSDATLRYDGEVKVPLYARHGVPEVWIVDLEGDRLHIYRAPADGQFTEVLSTAITGAVPVAALGGVVVDLAAVQ